MGRRSLAALGRKELLSNEFHQKLQIISWRVAQSVKERKEGCKESVNAHSFENHAPSS